MEKIKETKGIYFFLVALILTLLALLKLYSPFLMNFIIAFLLFVSTQAIYEFVTSKIKSNFLAAFVMTSFLLIVCFIPLAYIISALASIASNVVLENVSQFLENIKLNILESYHTFEGYLPTIIAQELEHKLTDFKALDWSKITKKVLEILAATGKNSLSFATDAVFIIIFLFFFYFYGKRMGSYFLELIPIKKEQIINLYHEASGVIGIVFYSSIISMILQGALFGILMIFYDYNAFLLAVFYGIASLIPIVGGALVWVPIVAYELFLGNIFHAIVIALYSIIIIGFLADNGVKPFIIAFLNKTLLKTSLKINEMLIFFAIIAGLSSFGFWGIVLGPAITALFIALLRIYQETYKERD